MMNINLAKIIAESLDREFISYGSLYNMMIAKRSGSYHKMLQIGWTHEDWLIVEEELIQLEIQRQELNKLKYVCSKETLQKVFDFIEEVYKEEGEWCDESRINYLLGEIEYYQSELNVIETKFEKDRSNGTDTQKRLENYFISNPNWYREKIKKLENEYNFIKNRKEYEQNKISPTDIERAREYPIEDLVDVNSKGFASCINHNETMNTPGMFCKNNFAHCFSCGFQGDVIDVYRKIHNCGFIDAVKFLSGRGR